jgi:molybdate transport system regulatory protein
MEPKFNLWIEVDGQVALSKWRVNLLRAVAATGSINAAAEQIDVPYRTAWQKIHEMEERLGVKLLETHTGGQHGGGARLTPAAEAYIDKINRLYDVVTPLVESAYRQIFNEPA